MYTASCGSLCLHIYIPCRIAFCVGRTCGVVAGVLFVPRALELASSEHCSHGVRLQRRLRRAQRRPMHGMRRGQVHLDWRVQSVSR